MIMMTVVLVLSGWVLVSVGVTTVYAWVRVAGDPATGRWARLGLPVAGTAVTAAGAWLVVAALG